MTLMKVRFIFHKLRGLVLNLVGGILFCLQFASYSYIKKKSIFFFSVVGINSNLKAQRAEIY